MKDLLTEFLQSLLNEQSPADKDPILPYVDKAGKQRKAKASTLSKYEKGTPGRDAYDRWIASKQAKPAKRPVKTPAKPAGAAQPPAAPKPATPQKVAKRTKTPDLQTTLATLDVSTVASVDTILSSSLGASAKNDILGGDSDQKRRVLSGELKVPGQGATATGPVHEVTVGLALDVLMKHPDIANEDVARLIENKIKDTKLGSSLGKKLYDTVLKAVKSAKAEAVRLTLGIQANQMNPETTVSDHYHGNEESKGRLVTDMLALSRNGYAIVTSAGKEISREDIPGLIKSAGSSAHGDLVTPGDTFVVSVDPITKKVILGTSSNKTDRGDQSLNTTVLKELQDYRSSLQSLVQSGYLNDGELKKVEQQLEQTDNTIRKLSSEVSSAFSAPVNKLGEPEVLSQFVSYVTEPSTEGTRKNLPKYFEKFVNPYLTFDGSKKKLSKKEQRIKNNLEAVGWKPDTEITQEVAAAAWVHDMKSRLDDEDENTGITGDEAKLVERFFQTRTDGKVDTSAIRMKALQALQSRHEALSNVQCTIEGKSLPVSQVVLGIFTARALHLEESLSGIPGAGRVYTQYQCYFKAVTGDIIGYPEANQAAVGTDNFADFCGSLEISEPKIARKRGSDDDAGTITFDIVSVTREGQKRSICARVMRTKGGTALNIVAVPLKGYTDVVAENQPKI